MAKAEAESAKRAKEILALTRKQVKAQEALTKKKKEEGILGQIAQRFDLERIQIAAALGGKINEVERIRLELMQAILDEDVKRAIILEGQLIKAEAAARELADLLDSLDEMVGDPFTDWPAKITRIQELLKQLKINIPIETLFAEKGLKLDQKTMTVTTIDRMDVDANNVYINGQIADKPAGTGFFGVPTGPIGLPHAIVVSEIADAVASAAAAEVALSEAELLLLESMGVSTTPSTNIEINVTVEGSLTTEQDLVETITDRIYQYQKTGGAVLLNPVAI